MYKCGKRKPEKFAAKNKINLRLWKEMWLFYVWSMAKIFYVKF